jgi:hypothetical protein
MKGGKSTPLSTTMSKPHHPKPRNDVRRLHPPRPTLAPQRANSPLNSIDSLLLIQPTSDLEVAEGALVDLDDRTDLKERMLAVSLSRAAKGRVGQLPADSLYGPEICRRFS